MILVVKGQTCNKFWTYSNYLTRSFYTGEIIYILAPDVSLCDFDNFKNCAYVRFPFYCEALNSILGYKNNIRLLRIIFENKISLVIMKLLQKYLVNSLVVDGTGSFKDERRAMNYTKLINIFAPNKLYVDMLNQLYLDFTFPNVIKVGIHVRRGDYRTFENGKYFFSIDEYIVFMKRITEIFIKKDVVFFVASNENLEKKVFYPLNVVMFKNCKAPATLDLIGLSKCDFILGPPSTFSAWAAYLNSVPICFLYKGDQDISYNSFIDINTIYS